MEYRPEKESVENQRQIPGVFSRVRPEIVGEALFGGGWDSAGFERLFCKLSRPEIPV
jgi:hypothetical protein